MKAEPVDILLAESNPADVALIPHSLQNMTAANRVHVVCDAAEAGSTRWIVFPRSSGHWVAPSPT